jgi:hypothetical protein
MKTMTDIVAGTKKYMSTGYLNAFLMHDQSYEFTAWDDLESLGWLFMDIRGHLSICNLDDRERRVEEYRNEIDVAFLQKTKLKTFTADDLIRFLREEASRYGTDKIIAISRTARRPIKRRRH